MAVMSDDKFQQQVRDLIKSIIMGDYTMEAAQFSLQQIKHGYSKSNQDIQGTILPALLSELASMMTEGMSKKQKLEVLQGRVPEFKEML